MSYLKADFKGKQLINFLSSLLTIINKSLYKCRANDEKRNDANGLGTVSNANSLLEGNE